MVSNLPIYIILTKRGSRWGWYLQHVWLLALNIMVKQSFYHLVSTLVLLHPISLRRSLLSFWEANEDMVCELIPYSSFPIFVQFIFSHTRERTLWFQHGPRVPKGIKGYEYMNFFVEYPCSWDNHGGWDHVHTYISVYQPPCIQHTINSHQ